MRRPSRCSLLRPALLAGCLALPATGALGGADEASLEGAAAGLSAQIEIERALLDRARADYTAAAVERASFDDRLEALHDEIEDLVAGNAEDDAEDPEGGLAERLAGIQAEIAEAERGRAGAAGRCAEALDRVRRRAERIGLLEGKLAELKGAVRTEGGALSGVWDVTYLPGGERGVFTLRQRGTIVTGRYTLDDGHEGSLRGTFIRDELVLERVDSILGRSSELEGYLEPDGRIRGSWRNFDLTDGATASGFWSAIRRTD